MLTKKELQKFEKLLIAERDRLTGNIRSIEDESRHDNARESGIDLAGYAETGTDNFERETALNIASVESERLAEIDDALRRIADGTYGVCEGSGKPIPKKRLEVFPSARYCVEYQEELERAQKQRTY
jgi:RNA polymerase-binding transcription factor DksA